MSEMISATAFQRDIGKYLHEVQTHNTTYIVTHHGRDAIVLLHPDEYERLLDERRRLARIGDNGAGAPQS